MRRAARRGLVLSGLLLLTLLTYWGQLQAKVSSHSPTNTTHVARTEKGRQSLAWPSGGAATGGSPAAQMTSSNAGDPSIHVNASVLRVTQDIQRLQMAQPQHNTSQGAASTSGPARVLLVTLYRGGSTFVGELFGQNKEAFYWFEPLIGYKTTYKQKANKYNGNVIEHATYVLQNGQAAALPESFHQPKTKALADVLQCNVAAMDLKVSDSHVVKRARSAPKERPYGLCRKNTAKGADISLAHCQPLLQRACASAGVVAAKTIRYPMSHVDRILEAVPDSKVIYYTRDPRGCMNSRRAIHHYTLPNMVRKVKDLCLRMEADYRAYLTVLERFPGRVTWVKYEDLSLDAVGVATRIYQFIEKAMPKELRWWISQNTNSKKTKGGTYGTRRNSTLTSQKWQQSLPMPLVRDMSSVCTNILELLGYPLPEQLGIVGSIASR